MERHSRVRTVPVAIRVAIAGGLVAVLAIVALVGLNAGPWRVRPPVRPDIPQYQPPDYDLPEPPEVDPPDLPEYVPPSSGDSSWLKWVLIGLGVLVLIALLYFAIQAVQQKASTRLQQRKIEVPAGSMPAAEPIISGADSGTFNPRIAADDVISAWQQVESAALASGIPRRPQHTATEFVQAVGQRVPIHPEAAQTLLAAYQRARFDHAALTEREVGIAVTCAERIVRDLRGITGIGTTVPPATGLQNSERG